MVRTTRREWPVCRSSQGRGSRAKGLEHASHRTIKPSEDCKHRRELLTTGITPRPLGLEHASHPSMKAASFAITGANRSQQTFTYEDLAVLCLMFLRNPALRAVPTMVRANATHVWREICTQQETSILRMHRPSESKGACIGATYGQNMRCGRARATVHGELSSQMYMARACTYPLVDLAPLSCDRASFSIPIPELGRTLPSPATNRRSSKSSFSLLS